MFKRTFRVFVCAGFALGLAACSSTVGTPSDHGNGAADTSIAADSKASPDGSGADSLAPDTIAKDVASQDVASQDVTTAPVSIIGTWSSNFGGYEEITDKSWNDMVMTKFDGMTRIAITQNPASDKYNPSKFNKIVFTAPKDGSFYYCYVDYGKDTAALAEASTLTADDSAPDTKGCGGFSWTKLTKADPIAIAGTWKNNFGGNDVISSRSWASMGSTMAMSLFDNAKRWAITQNPADDQYNPSKFNRIVWTAPSGGNFYYCMVDYGLDSVALAQATTKTADDSAPDKSGCGGFSWTKLAP